MLSLAEGDCDALGDKLLDSEAEGLRDFDSLALGDWLAEGERLALGD